MKLDEMNNLFVGVNEAENFKVCICALDKQEAAEIADQYRCGTNMEGSFKIKELESLNERFDCDYVLTYGG